MPTFAPLLLAAWTGGRWTAPVLKPLTGFGCDSRRLRAGEVFVALRTEQRDGHDFLADALAAGAGAALVARPRPEVALPQLVVADPLAALQAAARAHRRTFPGPVVGISGSAGKTSTKDLLFLLLGGEAGGTLATEGNLNNHLGVPLTLLRLDAARHTRAVIEAGISAPGDMAPLAAMIEPDLAIITLVAPAHTEALGGLEGVAREKALLPAAVRAGGLALFPDSVAAHAPFRALGGERLVVHRAEPGQAGPAGPGRLGYELAHGAGETKLRLGRQPGDLFTLPRVSDGMAQNAVLALCVARRLGVSTEQLRSRLVAWQPARLRGEVRRLGDQLLYLDCYNANPASMADALAAFTEIAPPEMPRLYLLGCMEELGPEAPALHRALGRHLQLRSSDQVFVIGTHASDVCAGLLEQGDVADQLRMVSTLEPAAAALAAWRGAVFVKGSRRYQLEKVLEVQTNLSLPC